MDGWDDTEEWEIPRDFKPSTKVSVIIAARNEEKYIGECIISILECNFSNELLEIIIINDHSEDKTSEIVTNIQDNRVKLIHLKDTSGKKNALEQGIAAATGELIACTDADCAVPANWLNSAVSKYEKHQLVFIAAPITYRHNKSTLQRFQYLDALNNMCVTANGIKKQTYYMANGANLFFTKSVFEEIGGYVNKSEFASGDDMFMIQEIASRYPNNVAFLKSKEAIVITEPESTLADLRSQRTRWATKSKGYDNKKIITIQGFVFCFVLLIFFNLIFSPLGSGLSLFGFLFALFIKWTMDYLYLSKLSDFFGNRKALKSFFPASIGFMIYILFAGWKALSPSKYNWKGRKLY